jgi:hypothetical protein
MLIDDQSIPCAAVQSSKCSILHLQRPADKSALAVILRSSSSYPAATAEAWMDGLVHAFAFFGGMPQSAL